MNSNLLKAIFLKPQGIIAGVVSLSAIGGVTVALLQPNSPSVPQDSVPQVSSVVSGDRLANRTPALSDQATGSVEEKTELQESSVENPASDQDADRDVSLVEPAPNLTNSAQKLRDSHPSKESRSDVTDRPLKQVERCDVSMAKISDPNPPGNVRSQPNTDRSTIVATLNNGVFVTVVGTRPGWLQISTPMKGWVSQKIVHSGCNQKLERVSFAQGQTRVTIADEFIGTGSHTYQLYLLKGQTLRLRSQRGPRPILLSPQGRTMTEMKDSAAPWTGKLEVSGDYKIVLESNFKGYRYAFDVVAE